MVVAERLGKTDLELMDEFTPEDLARWIAYIKIVADEERKAYEKSKPKSSRRGPVPPQRKF